MTAKLIKITLQIHPQYKGFQMSTAVCNAAKT